jgi:hypothetical protein
MSVGPMKKRLKTKSEESTPYPDMKRNIFSFMFFFDPV